MKFVIHETRSDLGHQQTDEALLDLEEKIREEYSKAVKRAKEKVVEYYAKFEEENAKWLEKLEKGTVTEQRYKEWLAKEAYRKRQVEGIVKSLEIDMQNARNISYSMINDYLPEVYEINANYTAYKIESDMGMNTNFALYDRQTVKRLIINNPKLLPKGHPPKNAQKWSEAKLRNEITQSILVGESNENIALRLQKVFEMDGASSIRNARTMTTSAECAGRQDSYERAVKMGIKLKKIWRATLDSKTRHEHRMVDGQKRNVDEPFNVDGHDMMYPADPTGEPYLVYNCRCTTVSEIEGFEDKDDIRNVSKEYKDYEEWKHAKEKGGKHYEKDFKK